MVHTVSLLNSTRPHAPRLANDMYEFRFLLGEKIREKETSFPDFLILPPCYFSELPGVYDNFEESWEKAWEATYMRELSPSVSEVYYCTRSFVVQKTKRMFLWVNSLMAPSATVCVCVHCVLRAYSDGTNVLCATTTCCVFSSCLSHINPRHLIMCSCYPFIQRS